MKLASTTRNLIVLTFTLLAFALPALAQGSKTKEQPKTGSQLSKEEFGKLPDAEKGKKQPGQLQITISRVVKEDGNAKNVAEGKLIPVRFEWLCNPRNNARLLELEAKLITLNSDGKPTRVTKKLSDWTPNKPITSVIDLPMAKDVFAKSFKLELVGKFHDGTTEQVVSTVKEGNFPVPIEAKR